MYFLVEPVYFSKKGKIIIPTKIVMLQSLNMSSFKPKKHRLAKWVFPQMVVPPKHPKMIIFLQKKTWLLGTSIVGNPHIHFV